MQEYIETGLQYLSDQDTHNELQEDQTKQVAEEVTQAVRTIYNGITAHTPWRFHSKH